MDAFDLRGFQVSMDSGEQSRQPKVGLVLSGGGARAAYQVGVLRAMSEMLPADTPVPFKVICGTSAGAINATVLAANAGNFRQGMRQLMTVWKNFHVDQVYRADPLGVLHNSGKWFAAALVGGLGKETPVSLLDNSPLRHLLTSRLDYSTIQRNIDEGHLHAFSITCSGYTSGQSVTFFQGVPGIESWQRARRIGIPGEIRPDHLLASSALPFIFPAVHINREFFGDGSMRQIAPVSPALHLGADRLCVIGVGRQLQAQPERVKTDAYPSLAQIAGHCLNSIFLDSLEVDLERLQRINRTLSIMPPEVRAANNMPLHEVDFRVISPSEALERIAVIHVGELPRTIRTLLYTVGALKKGGSNLISYLLFERGYCRALIKLGYQDAMQRRDELMRFLGYEACWL
jgi:NTE family protein